MSNKIIIREMLEKDIDGALNLWKVSFNEGFSIGFDTKQCIQNYLIRNPGFSSVTCTGDNKIIGALMCGHDGRRGSIYHTAVHKNYRKKGIGHKMEQRSISQLKDVGITTGFLFININNPGSKEFWTSIGWSVIEDVKYLYKQF